MKIMKTKLTILSTLAMVALVACQRETKVADNPTYDPVDNTVKTQFVMSISTGTGKDTKTTAEMAQVGSPFLGMDQVHLLAFNLDGTQNTTTHGHYFIKTRDAKNKPVAAVRDFNLGTLFTEKSVSSTNSSRTVELALPLGTNAVTFYGKATKMYDDDLQGYTKTEGNVQNLGSIKYSLKSRLTSETAFNAGAYFFSGILTYFAAAGLVDEQTFWVSKAGDSDRSYAFWWPQPSETDAASLATIDNPADQQEKTVNGTKYTYYAGEVSWKQMGEMYFYENDDVSTTSYATANVKTKNGTTGAAMEYVPLVEAMGSAYHALTTIKQDGDLKELRAGSSSSVLRICQDLYAIAERCADANATSWSEQCAKLLARELVRRMELFFEIKAGSGTLDFIRDSNGEIDIKLIKSRNQLATKDTPMASRVEIVNQYLDKEYFYTTNSDPAKMVYGFPINVGLPYGAAIMTCTTTGQSTGKVIPSESKHADMFSYTTDIPAYGMGGATFPIQNYRYPPELMYFGNSSLRVSDNVVEQTAYPGTVDDWNDEDWWISWTKHGVVTSTTRSVAVTNNINYGTALLASQVQFATDVLYDNNKKLHPGEENNAITPGGLLVTGIAIGGQPEVVGWDYVRRPDNAETVSEGYDDTEKKFTGGVYTNNAFDKMVYDRVVGGYTVGTSTTPIYTMLWDNYDATKAAGDQSDVYLAIELLNNTGKDFWGETNLIRQGGVFYLVGKIDLSAAKNLSTIQGGISRTDYCYPPYNPSTGATIEAPRVFMQDYMTTATLKLTETSLQHAYVTVPDLRSSQITLGVSIDMEWKPGPEFEVEMGTLN